MKQVTHIAASVNGQSRRGRSSLYKWVWEHFDQLSQDRQGRADWIAATEQLSALGLTGAGGSASEAGQRSQGVGTSDAELPCYCRVDAARHAAAPSPSLPILRIG
jgi:hypothetical protein